MKDIGKCINLNDAQLERDEETGFCRLVCRMRANIVDMSDNTITEAIIKAARAEGITHLYLLDKDFIIAAIREKMAREGYHEAD